MYPSVAHSARYRPNSMSLQAENLSHYYRCLVLVLLLLIAAGTTAAAQAPAASGSALTKSLGTVKSVSGRTLILTSEDGNTVTVTVPESARLARVAPGQKDLKDAVPIQLPDLQHGDRILVRGTFAPDKSLTAVAIIAMKKVDVDSKQQKEREDWQRRGIGGLVKAVDASAGTLSVSVNSPAGKKDIALQTSPRTVVRRYAPDSVKFDDAQPSAIAEIKPGDQLRARGQRGDDGNSFTADEIVFGSFRNIAGTISAVDAKSNVLSVSDVLTRQSVQVNVTPDSQLRKLPPMMAQRIAQRLKANASPDQGSNSAAAPAAPTNASASAGAAGTGPATSTSASGDLNQQLSRLPASSLSDFQKGDAVMIVSTEGSGKSVTAITVLGGVEPILASPTGSKDMVLSPWTLSGGSAEGGNP